MTLKPEKSTAIQMSDENNYMEATKPIKIIKEKVTRNTTKPLLTINEN